MWNIQNNLNTQISWKAVCEGMCRVRFNFKLLNYYIGAIFVGTDEFKRTRCKNKNRQDANRGRMETAWLVKR